MLERNLVISETNTSMRLVAFKNARGRSNCSSMLRMSLIVVEIILPSSESDSTLFGSPSKIIAGLNTIELISASNSGRVGAKDGALTI